MLKPTKELEQFKQQRIANHPRGYAANIELLEAMREHALAMHGGKLPARTFPEDIQHKINMAKALNAKLPESHE